MSVNLVLALLKELDAQIKTKETHLHSGGCADYTDYKTTVAHRQALVQTVALIKELAKDVDD